MRIINITAIALLLTFGTLSASAQDSKVGRIYNGQITKVDAKNKTITIKGPKDGLIPDSDIPRGGGARGGGGRGGGGRGGRGSGGGAAGGSGNMRLIEDVETKILWTPETTCEGADGKFPIEELRAGDYLVINTTRNGKKTQAVTIKRVTAAGGN